MENCQTCFHQCACVCLYMHVVTLKALKRLYLWIRDKFNRINKSFRCLCVWMAFIHFFFFFCVFHFCTQAHRVLFQNYNTIETIYLNKIHKDCFFFLLLYFKWVNRQPTTLIFLFCFYFFIWFLVEEKNKWHNTVQCSLRAIFFSFFVFCKMKVICFFFFRSLHLILLLQKLHKFKGFFFSFISAKIMG